MIITLKGANFSANKIGTISSWLISRSLGYGTTYIGPTYIDKNAALEASVTISDGYEIGSAGVSVTMGGIAVTEGITVDGSTVTINISSVTGNVVIKVPTKAVGGEEPENPGSGEVVDPAVLTPYSVATGFYLDSGSKFAADATSSVVVYSVQPNSTYTLSVEKKSGATNSNANLIFVPVKSLNGLQTGGTPDFATGYSTRVVEMSTNETNVLNYQFTTPADCIYLLFSNYKSGSTHTVVGVPGGGVAPEPERPEGTEVALTKAVDGVYLGQQAKYTADNTSQVLCYAVSPNKTYVIGAPSDVGKKLVVCCVKSIDNVAAGNTATFATGWSDRQIGDAGANLTVTTPADCTHLVFSNYQKGQAPSYVTLTD